MRLAKHPSYLSFELMSCGAVVVANINPANTWLLRHEETALVAEPSPTVLADALEPHERHAAASAPRPRGRGSGAQLWLGRSDATGSLRFMQGERS
jgi:hypothetical protein